MVTSAAILPQDDSTLPSGPKKGETLEEAASRLTRWHRAIANLMTLRHAAWFINIAFAHAIQWIAYNRTKQDIYSADEAGRIRVTIDRITPFIEDRLAKFANSRPKLRCVADTSKPDQLPKNREAALHSEYLLDYLDRKLNLPDIDQELCWWMLMTGRGIQRQHWDPTAGPTYSDTLKEQVNQALVDEIGQEIPGEFEPIEQDKLDAQGNVMTAVWNEGEIAASNVPSFRFTIDPEIKDIRFAPRVCEDTPVTAEEIEEEFGPEALKEIGAPQEDYDRFTFWERRLYALPGPNVPYQQLGPDINQKGFIRREYWEAPSKAHPRGLRVVTVNGTALGDLDTLPLDEGGDLLFPETNGLPYLSICDILTPFQFWCDSVVSHMIPVQKLYNAIRSLGLEHMKRFKGKWIAEENTITDADDFNDDMAQILRYDSMGGTLPPPKMESPAPLPAYYDSLLRATELELEDVSGRHDISQGQHAGIRSGRMGAFLAEKDDTRLGPKYARWERFCLNRGLMQLRLAKANYSDTRSLTVETDPHGNFNPRTLQVLGKDIIDNVVVVPGSATPRSRELKEQAAFENWKQGLYGIPETPQARICYMREAGVGNINQMFQPYWAACEKAEEENLQMTAAQTVMVKPWELHPYEIEVHRAFMLTKDFRALPPEIQGIFEQHLHETILASMPAVQPPPGGGARKPGNAKPGDPPAGGPMPTEPEPSQPGEMEAGRQNPQSE